MVFILLSSLIIFNAISAELPKFLTKQSIDSLRFVTNDGRVIYYQTKLGTLNMTKNYKNEKILELTSDTQFLISNAIENKVLIEADQTFHSQLAINKTNQIYVTELGDTKATLVAQGRNPHLELDGNWISFYSPKDKSIVFQNLLIEGNTFRIKLKNEKNPYFNPTHSMISDKDVFYTDVNSDGHTAILHYSKTDKRYHVVYKSRFPGSIVEYCHVKNKIIAFERGLFSTKNGSQIYAIPLFQNKDYLKKDLLYSSELNDIGSMVCKDDLLYFIKVTSYDEFLNDKSSEIAKLTFADKKIEILTDFKDVTNLTQLGNRILTRHGTDYYLIEGKNDAKNDSLGTQ